MKRLNIISILLILVGLEVKAQNQTYTQMFDSLFTNVSYGAVVSGILYDRVANMSDLDMFNQQTTDTSSYSHFIQAYSELHRAVINHYINQQFSLGIDSLKEKIENLSYIPIGIINAQYDIIDTNAFHNGKLYESNGLFYVNNAFGGSLFIPQYAILASPLIKEADFPLKYCIFANGVKTVIKNRKI